MSVEADHPVTRGVDPVFAITDELYLGHVFDDQVIPLLSSNFEYVQDNFYSTPCSGSVPMTPSNGRGIEIKL